MFKECTSEVASFFSCFKSIYWYKIKRSCSSNSLPNENPLFRCVEILQTIKISREFLLKRVAYSCETSYMVILNIGLVPFCKFHKTRNFQKQDSHLILLIFHYPWGYQTSHPIYLTMFSSINISFVFIKREHQLCISFIITVEFNYFSKKTWKLMRISLVCFFYLANFTFHLNYLYCSYKFTYFFAHTAIE